VTTTVRPVVAVERSALRAVLDPLRAQGHSVALVPTMGALHAAHVALVRRAHELADVVAVSIFVNPLQFGPAEDFSRYPRDLDADLAVCAHESVDVVLAPSVETMFPTGDPLVRVHAGPLGDVLEGAARPGHFDGVLTVVAKLFGMVRPDVAVFGAKDAQQLALVRAMVRDLDIPVRVEALPTVRDDGGLALSSRNRYLDETGRAAALALPRALRAGAAAAGSGAPPDEVVRAARSVLADEPGVAVDYVALVDPETFEGLETSDVPKDADADADAGDRDALLLLAARVGGTRLIDNELLRLRGSAR
jgi:pantoate--beta-alanine ligase